MNIDFNDFLKFLNLFKNIIKYNFNANKTHLFSAYAY